MHKKSFAYENYTQRGTTPNVLKNRLLVYIHFNNVCSAGRLFLTLAQPRLMRLLRTFTSSRPLLLNLIMKWDGFCSKRSVKPTPSKYCKFILQCQNLPQRPLNTHKNMAQGFKSPRQATYCLNILLILCHALPGLINGDFLIFFFFLYNTDSSTVLFFVCK